MGVARCVFMRVSFRRTSEEARCRRIRRHGVRRTHDRERQSMFLPRALKVVKCFFLGEVTRKEKTTQKEGEEKYSQRGRILS
jgi:hypothetical protein